MPQWKEPEHRESEEPHNKKGFVHTQTERVSRAKHSIIIITTFAYPGREKEQV